MKGKLLYGKRLKSRSKKWMITVPSNAANRREEIKLRKSSYYYAHIRTFVVTKMTRPQLTLIEEVETTGIHFHELTYVCQIW